MGCGDGGSVANMLCCGSGGGVMAAMVVVAVLEVKKVRGARSP